MAYYVVVSNDTVRSSPKLQLRTWMTHCFDETADASIDRGESAQSLRMVTIEYFTATFI